MAWKVLKQFNPQSATVWVEKIDTDDTVDIYDTEAEANTRITELTTADNTRNYKAVEIE